MEINRDIRGDTLILSLKGRLDTITAPQLENELKVSLTVVQNLILDMSALDYLSSAGLRVILSAQKKMNAKKGKMVVRHCNEMILDVFSMTGFLDILTIE